MSPQTRGYKTICDETRIIKVFTNRCVSSVLYSQIVTILHGYSQKKLPSESQSRNPQVTNNLLLADFSLFAYLRQRCLCSGDEQS